jgi:hypothetical protein
LTPEYIPGNEKWRFNVIGVNEKNEVIGGYKLYVTVTPLMDSQPEVKKRFPG